MWTPTKWQRMVLLAAATACFANAWRLYSDDDPAGSSFIAGVIFLVVALTRPVQSDDWLPALPPSIVRKWKAIVAATLVLAIIGTAFTFWLVQARLDEEVQRKRVAEAAERERLRTVTASEAKVKTAYELCLRIVAKESTDGISRLYGESRCENVRDHDLTKAREYGLSALEKAMRRDAQVYR